MIDRLVPGTRVRRPTEPDRGIGQVQSVTGDPITVTFENLGKLLINGAAIRLIPMDEEPPEL